MMPARQAAVPLEGALIIIGASTGGVRAVCTLLEHLPPINAALIVVQHMPRYIQPSFVRTLRAHTPLHVELAHDGAPLNPGTLLLAPGEVHCTLAERNQRIRLVSGPKVNFVCPAVDVTMLSVTPPPSNTTLIGVLLTGMGCDGAAGMVHLRKLGARTVAQDEASSAVFGMPKEAWKAGGADLLLPPERIAKRLAVWAVSR